VPLGHANGDLWSIGFRSPARKNSEKAWLRLLTDFPIVVKLNCAKVSRAERQSTLRLVLDYEETVRAPFGETFA
jgi:hypothetical protein